MVTAGHTGGQVRAGPARSWRDYLLVAFGLMPPVALALLLALQVAADWRRLLDEVEATSLTIAQMLSDHTDRLLENADLVRLQTEALLNPEALGPGTAEQHSRLRTMTEVSPLVVSIWVGDAEGRALITSRQHPAPDLSAADRDYFLAVRDDPSAFFVGSLPDNRYADQVLINTSRGLFREDGGFAGFVQVALAPEQIAESYRRARFPYQVALWWLAPDGTPLMREPYLPVDRLSSLVPPAFAEFGTARTGVAHGVSPIDGAERLYYFSRSPLYGGITVVAVTADDVTGIWWARVTPPLVLGGLLIAALLALLAFVLRSRARSAGEAAALERQVEARTGELADAMQQKQLLLEEMRHRVGNAYATIQALSMQMLRRSADLDQFRQAFPARLAALAEVQKLLVANDTLEAPLEDLVWSELAPYRDREEGDVSVEGPPVSLEGQRAVAIGLVLHELVTNAVKHGALSVPEGRVAVRWRWTPEGSVALTWREAGGPAVSAPTGTGFGSELLERTARLNGGRIALRYAAAGLEADLEMPIE